MTVRYYSSVAAETTLQNTATPAATTIQVVATTGFPALTPFTLALDYEGATEELVNVTGVAGTSLTVDRAIDGTSAATHNAGARVRHVSSARDFTDSRNHENASANIHGLGPGSDLVGTLETQTLSNKTLDDATGTLSNVDIFSATVGWTTVVNSNIGGTSDIMRWRRGPAEPHEVAKITNNGNFAIRNQNAAADSVFNNYRFRITKDDGTTDIFSVLSGGTATSWTNAGQSGFIVKPRTTNNDNAIRVRNPTDTADTFTVWNNGRVDVNGSDPAFSQLDVHGASGQSASIFRVMNFDESSTYLSVSSSGTTVVGAPASFASSATVGGALTSNGLLVANAGLDVTAGPVTFPLDTPAGTITAASGFSVITSNVKIQGDTVYALVVFERTGSTITAGADGSIADVDAFTLPAAMRPNGTYGGQSIPFAITDGFGGGWGRLLPSTGTFELVSWVSNGTIQSTRNIRVFMTYPAP